MIRTLPEGAAKIRSAEGAAKIRSAEGAAKIRSAEGAATIRASSSEGVLSYGRIAFHIMVIAMGADHAGFEVKNRIAKMLRGQGHTILDYGTCDETPVDYPQFGYVVGASVATGQAERGIVVCGSSLGIAMAANKVPGVRCAAVFDPLQAELSRRHNNANIVALSERLTGWEMLERLVEVFLTTGFDGGRHAWRVEQLFEYTDSQRERTLKALEAGEVTDAKTPESLLGTSA